MLQSSVMVGGGSLATHQYHNPDRILVQQMVTVQQIADEHLHAWYSTIQTHIFTLQHAHV